MATDAATADVPAPQMRVSTARRELVRAAIRLLAAEHADETEASYAAEMEYACEQVALAARSLYVATNQLPRDRQPVGWYRTMGYPL